MPAQEPLHPAKVEPLAAEAESVTEAPFETLALQVLPQLMPEGDEVSVPPPVPALVTLTGKVDEMP